jgi:deoxyhypusine synthase
MTLKVPIYPGKKQTVKKDPPTPKGTISKFMVENYRHFNARELRDAAVAYKDLIDKGGKMFVSVAGAMSTGELGITLAEMIRQDKIHGICCTGANLEEDVFNLVAHDKYESIPEYRMLDPEDEKKILDSGLSRVTDTCIPEQHAMEHISELFQNQLKRAEKYGERYFPHEYLYQMLRNEKLEHEIDPANSWMLAAEEKDLPIFVPGWEDSTLGNMFAAECIKGTYESPLLVKGGIEYMIELTDWYKRESKKKPGIGFFQIGGGIAGDFPICVVPMIKTDLKEECPFWSYFCQITDADVSYGGYSGADPNEKITWWKIDKNTPAFVIKSDATICAPLVFSLVLDK